MIYPSTISALKYFIFLLYQMFVFCAGLKVLTGNEDTPVIISAPPSLIITNHTKVRPKVKKISKLSRYRHNTSILSMLRNDANKGNSTSQNS